MSLSAELAEIAKIPTLPIPHALHVELSQGFRVTSILPTQLVWLIVLPTVGRTQGQELAIYVMHLVMDVQDRQ